LRFPPPSSGGDKPQFQLKQIFGYAFTGERIILNQKSKRQVSRHLNFNRHINPLPVRPAGLVLFAMLALTLSGNLKCLAQQAPDGEASQPKRILMLFSQTWRAASCWNRPCAQKCRRTARTGLSF
jgi:hypothetical protein